MHVYGPESHMTAIVSMALGKTKPTAAIDEPRCGGWARFRLQFRSLPPSPTSPHSCQSISNPSFAQSLMNGGGDAKAAESGSQLRGPPTNVCVRTLGGNGTVGLSRTRCTPHCLFSHLPITANPRTTPAAQPTLPRCSQPRPAPSSTASSPVPSRSAPACLSFSLRAGHVQFCCCPPGHAGL